MPALVSWRKASMSALVSWRKVSMSALVSCRKASMPALVSCRKVSMPALMASMSALVARFCSSSLACCRTTVSAWRSGIPALTNSLTAACVSRINCVMAELRKRLFCPRPPLSMPRLRAAHDSGASIPSRSCHNLEGGPVQMSGGIQCLYLSPLFVHSYPRHPMAPNPGRLQARLRRSPDSNMRARTVQGPPSLYFFPICHPERSACPESFEGKDLVVILCSCRGRISCGPRSFLPWAPMVLDPFAETKGTAPCGGETPHSSLSPCGGETPQALFS